MGRFVIIMSTYWCLKQGDMESYDALLSAYYCHGLYFKSTSPPSALRFYFDIHKSSSASCSTLSRRLSKQEYHIQGRRRYCYRSTPEIRSSFAAGTRSQKSRITCLVIGELCLIAHVRISHSRMRQIRNVETQHLGFEILKYISSSVF